MCDDRCPKCGADLQLWLHAPPKHWDSACQKWVGGRDASILCRDRQLAHSQAENERLRCVITNAEARVDRDHERIRALTERAEAAMKAGERR